MNDKIVFKQIETHYNKNEEEKIEECKTLLLLLPNNFLAMFTEMSQCNRKKMLFFGNFGHSRSNFWGKMAVWRKV